MEKLAQALTDYLLSKGKIVEEKSRIYQYGFQIGLEVSLNTMISIWIAIFCHMEWETIIFFGVFILLRSYAGGLHMRTYISCLICSCMSLLGLLLVVKYVNMTSFSLMLIIFFSLVAIKALSPVLDINRPVSSKELIKFAKKLNYSMAGILFFSLVLLFMQLNRLLSMVAATTLFTVFILLAGKIKYRVDSKKMEQNNGDIR